MKQTAGQMVIQALLRKDAARPRSKQVEIGVSSLGDCARRVWFQLNNYQSTNMTDNLAAIMGTAIHTAVEEAIAYDSFGTIPTEIEVEFEGLKGHIDIWIEFEGEIVDLKTKNKKNAAYFPSPQEKWQIHTYGYLKNKQDGSDVKKVTLVCIFRDGGIADVLEYSVPYDEAIALEALAWLENVKAMTEAPEPGKPERYCRLYCEFYGVNCGGIQAAQGKKRRHY